MRRGIAAFVLAGALTLVAAGVALAHVERTAYWPDPKADTSVSPPAGGKVPKARSLSSALRTRAPGNTRVVCHRDSLKRAFQDISDARKHGYVIRPSQPRLHIGARKARSLRNIN